MSAKRTWDDKRYYSLNYYLKNKYHEKLYKLSLNGGMTCPNRDGTLDTRGCIFCSQGGSGEFAASPSHSVNQQIEEAKKLVEKKNRGSKFIAYFQAYTNTYAPIEYLRKIFYETILHPDIAILSIATRPDCLNPPILDLLEELNQIKPVWIELGLQTIHGKTAEFIRRGYSLDCFETALSQLKKRQIEVIVHIIIGLPFETKEMLLETIDYLAALPINGIKLQLLHILRNTDLCSYVNQISLLTLDGYINLLLECLEHLPQNIVIHRVTGDGPKKLLLAPLWSSNKRQVLNQIHRTMKERDSWQGKQCP